MAHLRLHAVQENFYFFPYSSHKFIYYVFIYYFYLIFIHTKLVTTPWYESFYVAINWSAIKKKSCIYSVKPIFL